MSESLRIPKCNLTIVQLPSRIRVTEHVGEPSAKSAGIIQPGGRVLRRCHACGRLYRVDRGDSR